MIAAYGVGLMGLLGLRSGYVDVVSNRGSNDVDVSDFLGGLYN